MDQIKNIQNISQGNYLLLYEHNWLTEGTDLLADKKQRYQLNKNLHKNARSEQRTLKVLFLQYLFFNSISH